MNANRLGVIVVVICSLLAASFVRSRPVVGRSASQNTSNKSLAQMDSYALGLLLGGLRGPLVMMLWMTSENQKNERNLEDFDTKLQYIRMLQPEFDSVLLFQMWNRAYNISVQMANLPSKYSVVISAIDDGMEVRRERPENLNIESEIARIYFDKLGNSSEKGYYRQRVREDTMPLTEMAKFTFDADKSETFTRAALAAGVDPRRFTIRREADPAKASAVVRAELMDKISAALNDSAVKVEKLAPKNAVATGRQSQRTRLDSLLDDEFRILPQFVDRSLASTNPTDDALWRPQAGELQYLTRFEPYPEGVSVFALSYNYYKRSIALMRDRNLHHAQLSDRVVSSRAGLSLKNWAEEEYERGRRSEVLGFNRPLPESQDQNAMEMTVADISTDRVPLTPLMRDAIYSYQRSSQIAYEAAREYRDHLAQNREDVQVYASHIAWMEVLTRLMLADRIYLQIVTNDSPEQRIALARQATDLYLSASDMSLRNGLAFFANDEVIQKHFPAGMTKADVLNLITLQPGRMTAEQVGQAYAAAFELAKSEPGFYSFEELNEFRAYSTRAMSRVSLLSSLVGRQ
jgi:hypothetical protein